MRDELDIAALVQQEEGQFFDRKSLWEGPPGQKRPRNKRAVRDQIAEYVAAFANAEGGLLVLGVEDDGEPTGHGYHTEAVEDMLATPQRRLNPPQRAGRRLSHEGHELLVFEVEPAVSAVMVTGDGFPFRAHDQVVFMSEEKINALKQLGLTESAEARLAPVLSVQDLDERLIQRAMRSAGLGDTDVESFLLKRRVADRRGDQLILRQAAALLFARDALSIQNPNACVRIFRVQGKERLTGSRHNVQELPRVEGNLVQVIEQTHQVLTGQIRRSSKLHDLFFREMPEYPTFAWQEAVVNAVAHRDYSIDTRSIEVWLFEDRLEVRSPGGIVPGLRVQELKSRNRVHASRNPRITRVLSELAIMREQGEGIPRMIEEMEASWLPLPEFSSNAQGFEVVLLNTPLFEAGDPEWTAAVRDLDLSVRQKRILVARVGDAFTNADYQDLNDVNRDVAYREIKELVDAGLVVPSDKKGKGAVYRVSRLSDAELNAKTGFAGPIRRLRERMAKNGLITNADYREIFEVSRGVAKNGLRELVDAGILQSEGKGRGAHYLPGPDWDGWPRAR